MVEGLIEAREFDLFKMEVVRDYNLSKDPESIVTGGKTAAVEADAAEHKMGEINIELTWLRGYLKKCL